MEKKSDKGLIGLIILLIILFLIVLALVGYIVWDKTNNKELNNGTSTTTTTINVNDLSNSGKSCEEEKSDVYNDMISLLSEFLKKEMTQYDIKFNYNYMEDDISKNNIVISAMMENNKIIKELDVDLNGKESTGTIIFNKSDFVNTYYNIIGEQPDFNKILNLTEKYSDKIQVKEEKLSASYVTGPTLNMLKPRDFVCSNNEYSLKIDYVYETYENSDKMYETYDDYEKNKTFDDNLINAIIDINFDKISDNTYKINYLRVLKNNNF